MTDRLSRAKAAIEPPKPDPFFQKDAQRSALLSQLDRLNDERNNQGYPPITTTATKEELELTELFGEIECAAIGQYVTAHLTPPFLRWQKAKAAIAYLKE